MTERLTYIFSIYLEVYIFLCVHCNKFFAMDL